MQPEPGSRMDRRTLLASLGASALATTVAGCSGDGGGSAPSGGGGPITPAAPPEDAVAAPTGEGTLDIGVSRYTGKLSAWSAVESMTAEVGHVVLHRESGSPVVLQLDRTLDLTQIDSDAHSNLAAGIAVPAATYTTAAFYMPVQSATLAEGGTPSSLPDGNPVSVDLKILEDYFTVDTEFSSLLTLKLILQNDGGALSFSTGVSYS